MTIPVDLVALAALLLVDRLLVSRVARHAYAFWALQAVNLGAAAWFAVMGIAGIEGVPLVRWLVVVILLFHVVQGWSIRSRLRWEDERRRSERAIRQGRPPFDD